MESLPADSTAGFAIGTNGYRPLPSGRHALPEGVVARDQKARLERAILELVGDAGYAEVAVKDVLARAGTSRRVFYAHYADKADCFQTAYLNRTEELEKRVTAASAETVGFASRVQAALTEIAAALDEDRSIARALLIEVHAAGARALSARRQVMTRAADGLRKLAGQEVDESVPGSTVVAEGVLGGLEQSARAVLAREDPAPLAELVGEFTQFVCLVCQPRVPEGAAS